MEIMKRGIPGFRQEPADQGKIVSIAVNKIAANPLQPRKVFYDEAIEELSGSIKEYGVLQPIILRENGGGEYTIIAGERRYRAAKMAGLEKIPAIVRAMEEQEAALVALVENVQREDWRKPEHIKNLLTTLDLLRLRWQKKLTRSSLLYQIRSEFWHCRRTFRKR